MSTGLVRSKRWEGWKVAPSMAKIQEQGIAMMRAGLNKAPVVKFVPKPNLEPFGGFSFRLPWAPSVNNVYANSKTGGRFKVKRAKVFAEQAILSMIEQKVPVKKLVHPLAVSITQHASAGRGDIDNGLKVVLDVIKNHGVIADDSRNIVKRVSVQDGFRVNKGEEFIEVRIECLAELEA